MEQNKYLKPMKCLFILAVALQLSPPVALGLRCYIEERESGQARPVVLEDCGYKCRTVKVRTERDGVIRGCANSEADCAAVAYNCCDANCCNNGSEAIECDRATGHTLSTTSTSTTTTTTTRRPTMGSAGAPTIAVYRTHPTRRADDALECYAEVRTDARAIETRRVLRCAETDVYCRTLTSTRTNAATAAVTRHTTRSCGDVRTCSRGVGCHALNASATLCCCAEDFCNTDDAAPPTRSRLSLGVLVTIIVSITVT